MKRLAIPSTILMMISLAMAGPALAAAPPNDLYDDRISIPVGTTVTENTTKLIDKES